MNLYKGANKITYTLTTQKYPLLIFWYISFHLWKMVFNVITQIWDLLSLVWKF